MTSATELLRKLLDKRGVEYDESTQGNTTFFRFDYRDSCGDYLHTIAITGACISAYSDYFTPEQAIAATLGNPTCEYVIEDNMNETEGMGDVWFRCTNCDMCFDYADDWLLKMPYCPKCGATVKGVR